MENNYNYCPKCNCYPCCCQQVGWIDTKMNYECPDCHGKFNSPAIEYPTTSTKLISKCPFCGRLMLGL